jgi:hypothetical protein
VLLYEQSWLHTAIAVCSCTYTVCFYGVYTLAFVPTVFINTQRLPSQIDINHQRLTSSFVQHHLLSKPVQSGGTRVSRTVLSQNGQNAINEFGTVSHKIVFIIHTILITRRAIYALSITSCLNLQTPGVRRISGL